MYPVLMVFGSARFRTLENCCISSLTVHGRTIPDADPAGTISSYRKWTHVCWNWDEGKLLTKIAIMCHGHILDQWINVLSWKYLILSNFVVFLIGKTYVLVS